MDETIRVPTSRRYTMDVADIVISKCGRDAGKRFIVIETEGEYSLIADGKLRRVEKPKRKKNKHLKPEGKAVGPVAEKLAGGGQISNSELRRTLAEGGVPDNAKR